MILNLDFVSSVPGYQKKIILLNFKPAYFKHCFSDRGEVVQFLEEPLSLGRTIKKKSKQSTGG